MRIQHAAGPVCTQTLHQNNGWLQLRAAGFGADDLIPEEGAELSSCNKEGRKSELQSWDQNSARGRSEHMVQAQMHAQTHHKLHGPAAEPTNSWQAPSPRLLLALCHFSNMTWLRRVYSHSSGDTSSIKTRVSNTNSSRNIQFSKYNSGGC